MRNCFLSIWGIIDPIYYFFSRLTVIDKEKQSVFRVRLTRYKGAQIILSDGTKIKKNDVLVKIHLHNIKLMRELRTIESAVRKGMIIYQKVYISMPLLVDYISKHKKGMTSKELLESPCSIREWKDSVLKSLNPLITFTGFLKR